jgi:hypothetical protein
VRRSARTGRHIRLTSQSGRTGTGAVTARPAWPASCCSFRERERRPSTQQTHMSSFALADVLSKMLHLARRSVKSWCASSARLGKGNGGHTLFTTKGPKREKGKQSVCLQRFTKVSGTQHNRTQANLLTLTITLTPWANMHHKKTQTRPPSHCCTREMIL